MNNKRILECMKESLEYAQEIIDSVKNENYEFKEKLDFYTVVDIEKFFEIYDEESGSYIEIEPDLWALATFVLYEMILPTEKE